MRGGKVSGPERDVRRILREIADMIEAEGRGMKFRKKPVEIERTAQQIDLLRKAGNASQASQRE